MSATVTQEIMSSAFVTSMFMVPSSDDEEGPYDSPAPVPAPVVPPSTPLELLEALVDGRASLELPESYWKGYDLSNSLGLGDIGSIPVGPCDTAAVPVAHLADTGYAVCQPDSLFSDSVCPALVAAVRKLTEDGWPPIFVFVFDALWVYVAKYVQASMGAILAGESFTLPHRDYPYTEAFDSAGRPSIMNVWVPLTPATLDNGCMYVLPREFDPLFDQPDHPNHLKCALPGPGQGEFRCRMNLGGARPLPAPAGSVLCWNGNTIHWGTSCSKHAPVPRVSFSVAFRKKSSLASHLESSNALASMTPSQTLALTLPDRVRLIAKGLLLFKWWFGMDTGILPQAFYDAVKVK